MDNHEALIESFVQFMPGNGPNDGNDINTFGCDNLNLLVTADLVAGSPVTHVLVRLQFSAQIGVYFPENALDPGAVAAGVMPVGIPAVEYQIPVTAARRTRKILSVPVVMPMVRVTVSTSHLPDADDAVEVGVIRFTTTSDG